MINLSPKDVQNYIRKGFSPSAYIVKKSGVIEEVSFVKRIGKESKRMFIYMNGCGCNHRDLKALVSIIVDIYPKMKMIYV